MPSQQEVKWSQLKVGLIVIISLVLLSILVFLMSSASGMSPFSKKLTAYTYFPNSNGLKVGAPVNLEGVTIGDVKRVQVINDPLRKLTPIMVEMKINPKFHTSLHTDTLASQSTVGVLGDTIIDLNSVVAAGPEFQDGAEFHTADEPSISDVVKSSKGTIDSVNMILAKMDDIVDGLQQGKGSAGALLKDRALYDNLNETLNTLRALTVNLTSGRGSAGKLLTDETLYNKLNSTANRLDAMMASLQSGKGTAGKLLTDDKLYDNLNSTLAHANSLLTEADGGRGALGMLVKDPVFAQKLNDTVTNLDSLLAGVNSGKGTLGQLATNEETVRNLNKLLTSSTTLVETIRADPKKYLTIHMRIF